MKPPQLQGTIIAHLKAAGVPQSSRDLAERFLRIRGADEETCRRLLAPILAVVDGVRFDPATGWRFEARAATRATTGAEVTPAGATDGVTEQIGRAHV